MHLRQSLLFLLPLLFCCSSPGTKKQKANLNAYQWLLGKWEMTSEEGLLTEEWKQVNDSTFAATSSLIDSSGQTLFSETIELNIRDGITSYVPTVPDQNDGKPVYFQIIGSKGNSFIAENGTHDFPQQIVYELRANGELFAKMAGMQDGKWREEVFRMQRKK